MIKRIHFSAILIFSLLSAALNAQWVRPGVDCFLDSEFKIFKGKKIGLITNATGLTSDLRSTIDAFHEHEDIELTALFGPEHGIRGDVTAGGKIDDSRDAKTGLPVYSLYGKNRKPTAEMLKDVDVLVYDIQDIGNRTYTYIYTMAYAMEAAAEQNLDFVVLDRPTPLYGRLVDGNVLDKNYSSFIGRYPIAYVYGMTPGELAGFFNTEFDINCRLSVVTMDGYDHSMTYSETGMTWVPTSPHIPRAESAAFCAATGTLGEMHTVCVGIGYTQPFELIGRQWINGDSLAFELNGRRLPGVFFRPAAFKPYYSNFKDEACGGVQMIITDEKQFLPFTTQVHILDAIHKLYPESDFLNNQKRIKSFDRAAGTENIRKAILAGQSADAIIADYQKDLYLFKAMRRKYLLYDE